MLIVYGSDSSTAPEHVTAVAQQIAQALRRAGLHEHEHRVAERLQLSLLPQLPQLPGLETATCYAPGSDLLSVGGDGYDVYDVAADHIGLSIGDVAGHGLHEATVMAQVTAALRNIVPRCGADPAAVLDEVNTFLGRYHPERIATVCYLVSITAPRHRDAATDRFRPHHQRPGHRRAVRLIPAPPARGGVPRRPGPAHRPLPLTVLTCPAPPTRLQGLPVRRLRRAGDLGRWGWIPCRRCPGRIASP
ncbi:PP2C family protein-serine/threonine phosphatase [Streptomyces sp. NRRL S-481]|uniref:PP2C family protein-serine/threonine phosphatase n=1 Tax=Streptomyces sp. NRRL S-481 TaxID=1463911 RepID=UPI00131EA4BB|nr:SpoIIE family protein phosphatase [Streptomyces sp. NRRL S-481]